MAQYELKLRFNECNLRFVKTLSAPVFIITMHPCICLEIFEKYASLTCRTSLRIVKFFCCSLYHSNPVIVIFTSIHIKQAGTANC